MSVRQTLIFTDLTGTVSAYEALGNELVAEVIGTVTQWMGRVCSAYGGRTIRLLDNGVLALFPSSIQAISAAVFLQRGFQGTRGSWPDGLQTLGLKIGMAGDSVVQVEGDVFGEAVNLAARLCELAGADTIWAEQAVVDSLHGEAPPEPLSLPASRVTLLSEFEVRHRSLGRVQIRGLIGNPHVVEIFWSMDLNSELLTRAGNLSQMQTLAGDTHLGPVLVLSRLDVRKEFLPDEQGVLIGRSVENDFVVGDQRVSRVQARIVWSRGVLELTDLSSYGSWVRFSEDPGVELALRRSTCVLRGSGEIALGAPFSDLSAPVVAFEVDRSSS